MTGTPPGWYPDPQGTTRWFDGAAWTAHTWPPPGAVPGPSGGVPPRRGRGLVIGLVVVAVVLVLGVVSTAAVLLVHGHGTHHHTSDSSAATARVITTITSVPAAAYDEARAGGTSVAVPDALSGGPLTDGGKPEVLYVGADYCPFCAPERWALVAALARFGTFHGLGLTSSASDDVFPDTATLSFHGATYTSPYLSLHAYETEDREENALDPLTGSDKTVFDQQDAPPLTAASSAGAIPFLDVGGAYAVSGASFTPQLLADMSHQQVADAAVDPDTPVGQAVLTTADYLTAAICHETDERPTDVCTGSGVTAAAARLPAAR